MTKSEQILTDTLSEAIDIIDLFDVGTYTKMASGSSSVGAHFRHLIEFIESLIITLEKDKIFLDYDKRSRKLEIEMSPTKAKKKIIGLILRVKQLDIKDNQLIYVKDNEEDHANSSPLREAVFVQSHTVHHFGIIKLLATNIGIKLPTDLGLAASTKAYLKENVHATN